MTHKDKETRAKRIAEQKEEVLEALAKHSGIIASTCRACNISRLTYYNWYHDDPDFAEKCDDIKEAQKDFAESLILKKMKEGDTTMIIFYAKTQLKDRGYTERQELTGKDGADLLGGGQVDLSKLTDEQRKVLLSIGRDILDNKETE